MRPLPRSAHAIAGAAIRPPYEPALARKSPFDRPRPAHERALDHFRAGRFADAAAGLTAALREHPTDATAWSDLGVVHAAMGRIDIAMTCYAQALALAPDHAGALGNKGIALSALGRPSEALVCHDRAVALAPDAPEHRNNRGGALRALGRPTEALACFEAALARQPRSPDALSNRGAALLDLRRFEEALASFDKALRLDPNRVEALTSRGVALAELGRLAEAIASYDRAIARDPRAATAHNNRGAALHALGRHPEAIATLLRALAILPNYPEALNNLGNVLLEAKRPLEALKAYDAALGLRPDFVAALGNRARALLDIDRPNEAIESCDRALALAPADFTALNARGVALSSLGRESEAIVDYDAALASRPGAALPLNNKGLALIQVGLVGEGVAVLDEALLAAPGNARIHYNRALAKRFDPFDPGFAALGALVAPDSGLGPEERLTAEFALAKAFDDIGDVDAAFRLFARANAAKRAMMVRDEAAELDALAGSRTPFAPALMAARAGAGDLSRLPLFIVGMPRSGTSLVEQILASHPRVHGAGEIRDFERAARELGGAIGEVMDHPRRIADVSDRQLAELGASYVRRIEALAPGATRIVNKMPGNFRVAGLIALALPNARIVHVSRDPRDTCLSCFATLFTRDLPFAYDLGELGRYHRVYRRLMDGWEETLPAGMMLEVRYEDIVADLESQARRIVAHCGLDWDPNCLDFHRGASSVRSASLAQVRRPLYASSVGRWRPYARHLAPLLEAL